MAEKKRNLAEEGQDNITTGHVYKEDNSSTEVIPYYVDFANATVNFAPVGRATEDRMRTSDFLNRFTYVGPVSSMAEEQVSNEDREKAILVAQRKEASDAKASTREASERNTR